MRTRFLCENQVSGSVVLSLIDVIVELVLIGGDCYCGNNLAEFESIQT